MITGVPKFSGLTVVSMTVAFKGTGYTLSAQASLVDPSTNGAYAFTKSETNWSPETMERLAALRLSMEADMAAVHFTDTSRLPTQSRQPIEPGGLGEMLAEADQV